MKNASEQFKPGDVVLGGVAVVLATKRDYVLAIAPQSQQPFVTWWVSPRGEVLSGTYHREIGDAIRSLSQRAADAAARAAA